MKQKDVDKLKAMIDKSLLEKKYMTEDQKDRQRKLLEALVRLVEKQVNGSDSNK